MADLLQEIQGRLIVAHAVFPWVEECTGACGRIPQVPHNLSYMNSVYTPDEIYLFLLKCKAHDPSWSKIC